MLGVLFLKMRIFEFCEYLKIKIGKQLDKGKTDDWVLCKKKQIKVLLENSKLKQFEIAKD